MPASLRDQTPYDGQAEAGGGGTPIFLPLSDWTKGALYASVTHPDVLFIPEGFAGYKYWMACTPYPDIAREQPEIFSSHNGVDWFRAAENPIAVRQEAIDALGANSWLADTDLMYHDGKLWCYYTRFNTAPDSHVVRRFTTDGYKWSAPEVVIVSLATPSLVSPALVPETGPNITMFHGRASGTPSFFYRTSTDGGKTWSAESACTFPKCTDDKPDHWHIDVIKVSDTYHALVAAGGIGVQSLWYYTSRDKINWTLECTEPAVPINNIRKTIDGVGHYRSTFVAKEGGLFDIWASCIPSGATLDDTDVFPTLSVVGDSGADTLTVSDVAHPSYLDDGDEFQIVSGTPPSPLALNTTYFVVNRSSNATWQVATTKGGAPVNLTTNGSAIRLNRNPWTIVLYRNVALPMTQHVIQPRRQNNSYIIGAPILTPVLFNPLGVAAWWNTNWGIAVRLIVEKTTKIRYMCCHIGVSSGNIELAIARATGTNGLTLFPIRSTGAIASPGTGLRKFDFGDTVLVPGHYWLWVWADNVTVTFLRNASINATNYMVGAVNLTPAGGLVLPKAGATISVSFGDYVPFVWLQGDF